MRVYDPRDRRLEAVRIEPHVDGERAELLKRRSGRRVSVRIIATGEVVCLLEGRLTWK